MSIYSASVPTFTPRGRELPTIQGATQDHIGLKSGILWGGGGGLEYALRFQMGNVLAQIWLLESENMQLVLIS